MASMDDIARETASAARNGSSIQLTVKGVGVALAKFNAEAMDQCRSTASSQAGHFGAVGDGFTDLYGNPDVFGKLAVSGGVASAVSGVDEAAATEFAAAEALLGKVERALDTIQQAVANIDDQGADNFRVV
jgi:hypothetical protein